jgi:hypothetical protein
MAAREPRVQLSRTDAESRHIVMRLEGLGDDLCCIARCYDETVGLTSNARSLVLGMGHELLRLSTRLFSALVLLSVFFFCLVWVPHLEGDLDAFVLKDGEIAAV